MIQAFLSLTNLEYFGKPIIAKTTAISKHHSAALDVWRTGLKYESVIVPSNRKSPAEMKKKIIDPEDFPE